MNIDRTHSFPLGSRQASIYGFGYDQTNDRFLVPNVNKVNTYDKAVVSAARSYQRFDLAGISYVNQVGRRLGPLQLLVKGNRAYVFGGPSPRNGFSINRVNIFTWPDLQFIEQKILNTIGYNTAIIIDGRLFIPSNPSATNPIIERSLTTFDPTTSQFTLAGMAGDINFIYKDGDTIYAKGSSNNYAIAYSASGTANKNEILSKRINLDVTTRSDYRSMFSDNDYFYFGRISRSANTNGRYPVVFDAYSKTTRLRDTNGDFNTDMEYSSNSPQYSGANMIDSTMYASQPGYGRVFAFVKAV